MASFLAGLIGGGAFIVFIQNRFPGFLPSAHESKLIEKIEMLENRINKKDELIKRAVRSVDRGERNED